MIHHYEFSDHASESIPYQIGKRAIPSEYLTACAMIQPKAENASWGIDMSHYFPDVHSERSGKPGNTTKHILFALLLLLLSDFIIRTLFMNYFSIHTEQNNHEKKEKTSQVFKKQAMLLQMFLMTTNPDVKINYIISYPAKNLFILSLPDPSLVKTERWILNMKKKLLIADLAIRKYTFQEKGKNSIIIHGRLSEH
jgi:hypothetical protein